jgi:hypothetical protein
MTQTLQAAQERLSTLTGGSMGSEYKFPAFDELPKVEGMPQGSIWGFYDKNDKKDEVGGWRPFFRNTALQRSL